MGSTTFILFMSVEQKDITLPILNWMDDKNKIWSLLENARDRQSQNILFELSEKYGNHFYDIVAVKDRCNLQSLDFLDLDLLEDETGTTLQNTKLVSAIHSITIIIDELLCSSDKLYCLPIGHTINKENMQKAFSSSKIHHNLDLGNYDEEGLFIILKALLLVMTDALVNNKVFVYIKFTV